jgi:hypothetical protein
LQNYYYFLIFLRIAGFVGTAGGATTGFGLGAGFCFLVSSSLATFFFGRPRFFGAAGARLSRGDPSALLFPISGFDPVSLP